MTQKNNWNISVKELMEEYQVTEQGLSTARAEELRLERGKTSCRKAGAKVYWKYLSVSLLICW